VWLVIIAAQKAENRNGPEQYKACDKLLEQCVASRMDSLVG